MATYTAVDQIDVPAVARAYGIEPLRLVPLAGGAANSSFRLSTASDEYVLTVLDDHDAVSAGRLAVRTRALRRLGVPTCTVVPTTDGSLVAFPGERPVLLKEWIEGEVHRPLPLALLPEAGRVLARLHTLPAGVPGLADLPVGTRRLTPEDEALIPAFADREFAAWTAGRLARVRAGEAGRERVPVIVHGDLFDDNVLVRGDRLAFLDWETVSLDDPLLDLGMAAVGLARVDGALDPERLRALLDGYQETAALSAEDLALLPLEIVHAALIIAFHRYRRHTVHRPDPALADHHREMVGFVASVERDLRVL
ncbi:phosphotransferase [Streptomyces sp. NPDC006460]|uniref:phosphotransferase n=1 Tax=Streptomyces sp. NPDC006460 TaxID=3154304 RepID=UPI0033AA956C